MHRRDILKLLTGSAAFSIMPLQSPVTMREARAQIGEFSGVRTMNPHQNATVVTISELIIPETNTPGAKGAKVNEFIDLLLTEWFDASETKRFLVGLDKVDTASRKRFQKDFVDCSADQQHQLMTQFDTDAMAYTKREHAAIKVKTTAAKPVKSHPPAMLKQTPMELPEFFYTLKKLTIFGYYTSEIGFSQELGDSIIPPGHDGCAPLKESA